MRFAQLTPTWRGLLDRTTSRTARGTPGSLKGLQLPVPRVPEPPTPLMGEARRGVAPVKSASSMYADGGTLFGFECWAVLGDAVDQSADRAGHRFRADIPFVRNRLRHRRSA